MLDFVIGLLSAIGSALAFGSFGVPIKCKRVLNAKVTTDFGGLPLAHTRDLPGHKK
jgi:hypothetical protein